MVESLCIFRPCGKCYRLNVSGIKYRTFTARWDDDEPDEVDMRADYGQLDNDVEFYTKSRTPVDRRKPDTE